MTEPITSDLHQLNLHPRTCNALRRAKVHTVADLLRMGRALVSGLYLIGPFAMRDITHGLEVGGFCWTVEGAPPLPELPSAAARIVEALRLGDSPEIRRRLAMVLYEAHFLDKVTGMPLPRLATELENGAQ